MTTVTRQQGPGASRPGDGEVADTRGAVRAGVVVGLIAGAAMLLVVAAAGVRADHAPWHPLALAASTFARDAIAGGAGHLAVGALLWAVVSVALALLYASFVPRDHPFASAAAIGVGYATAVLGLMASIVLPRVNPAMRAAWAAAGGAWVVAFAIYGVALGLVPLLRRRWSAAAPARLRRA